MLKKLLLIALGVFVFFGGAYVGQATFEPKVIVKTGVVYQVVEVEKEVIKIVEVPAELRHFDSLSELEEWLPGVIKYGGDCDDLAFLLQRVASRDGFLIDFELIYPNEYNRLFRETKLRFNTTHAINTAIIGNSIYYIEPQSREVVFVTNLD